MTEEYIFTVWGWIQRRIMKYMKHRRTNSIQRSIVEYSSVQKSTGKYNSFPAPLHIYTVNFIQAEVFHWDMSLLLPFETWESELWLLHSSLSHVSHWGWIIHSNLGSATPNKLKHHISLKYESKFKIVCFTAKMSNSTLYVVKKERHESSFNVYLHVHPSPQKEFQQRENLVTDKAAHQVAVRRQLRQSKQPAGETEKKKKEKNMSTLPGNACEIDSF